MIKTIYHIALVVFVGLSITSCNKDIVPNNNDSSSTTSEVYAGVYDTTFSYYQFSSPLQIAITWDAQNLYGVGYDSLDLDFDGSYDLHLTLNLLNEDSLHLVSGMPNPFPSCVLNAENGFEVAFYSESYSLGQGQTATATFADRLDVDERIDVITNWDTNLKMWGENPGGAGNPPFGDWYSASTENYLAIRINNNNYGWIEIDATNPKNPKIVSFALQE